MTNKMSQVCEFNTSYMVDTPPQVPGPSGPDTQKGGRRARPVWSKPPVLCFLYPTAIHRSTLNLWLFLLQSGETALHVAARYGHADVVQLLCNFGSNPNFQDKVGHGSLISFCSLCGCTGRPSYGLALGVLSKFLLRFKRAGTQNLTFINLFPWISL